MDSSHKGSFSISLEDDQQDSNLWLQFKKLKNFVIEVRKPSENNEKVHESQPFKRQNKVLLKPRNSNTPQSIALVETPNLSINRAQQKNQNLFDNELRSSSRYHQSPQILQEQSVIRNLRRQTLIRKMQDTKKNIILRSERIKQLREIYETKKQEQRESQRNVSNKKKNYLIYVQKFINYMKLLLPYRKEPNQMQKILIGDMASDKHKQDDEKDSKYKSKFLDYSEFIQEKSSAFSLTDQIFQFLTQATIDIENSFFRYFSIFKIILTFYLIFQISILLAFKDRIHSDNIFKFQWPFIFMYYSVEIIIGFKVKYYKNEELISNPLLISRNYLKKYFCLDIITLIPLAMNCFRQIDNAEDYINFDRAVDSLVFLKVISLNKTFQQLQSLFQRSFTSQMIYQLVSLGGFLICYAHVIGCLWYIVGYNSGQVSWVKYYQIDEEQWYGKYVYSLYWSITTMCTVGYGDITPKNKNEIAFSIIVMLLSSIVFAYSLNTMGNIISEITQTYMDRKQLTLKLKQRIRQYFLNKWQSKHDVDQEQEIKIIEQLTPSLKQQMKKEIYGKWIYGLPLFYRNFSSEFMKEIIFSIKEERVPQNSTIFNMKSSDNKGLYILLDGEIEKIIKLNDRVIKLGSIKRGESFGQSNFFSTKEHPYTTRTLVPCSYGHVSLEQFQQILKKYRLDYLKYRMIQEKLDDEQDQFMNLGIKCQACNNFYHDIDVCPTIHLQINKQWLIRKHNYCPNQQRLCYQRIKNKRTHTLSELFLFQENAIRLLINDKTLQIGESFILQLDRDDTNSDQDEESQKESQDECESPSKQGQKKNTLNKYGLPRYSIHQMLVNKNQNAQTNSIQIKSKENQTINESNEPKKSSQNQISSIYHEVKKQLFIADKAVKDNVLADSFIPFSVQPAFESENSASKSFAHDVQNQDANKQNALNDFEKSAELSNYFPDFNEKVVIKSLQKPDKDQVRKQNN